jgi:hypothetical protein
MTVLEAQVRLLEDVPTAEEAARSSTFRSSRTLPGHEYAASARSASGERRRARRPRSFDSTESSWRARIGNVLDALAQRRHAQRDRADPEVEVAPELLLLYELGQALVRRGDQLNVDLAVAHLAEPAEAFLLEHLQQLGLHLRVEVADLVEEHDAAVGDLEQPLLAVDRARVGALLVAEELRSRGTRATARRSSCRRTARRRAGRSGGASARARPCRCPSRPRSGSGCSTPAAARVVGEPPDRGRRAREGIDASRAWRARPAAWRRFSRCVSSSRRSITTSAGSSTGLARNWSAPSFTARTGEVDRGVAGQDHDGQARVDLADPRQQLERGAVGQHVVEHERVRMLLAHEALRGGCGVGLFDLEALALEEIADAEADPGLVVDDQDLGHSRRAPSLGAHCRMGGDGGGGESRVRYTIGLLGATEITRFVEEGTMKKFVLSILALSLGLATSALAQSGSAERYLEGRLGSEPGRPQRGDRRAEVGRQGALGTVNPGPNAVALQKATFDSKTNAVHFEADAKDRSGATVHFVIDGKVDGKTMTGSWSHDDAQGRLQDHEEADERKERDGAEPSRSLGTAGEPRGYSAVRRICERSSSTISGLPL